MAIILTISSSETPFTKKLSIRFKIRHIVFMKLITNVEKEITTFMCLNVKRQYATLKPQRTVKYVAVKQCITTKNEATS